MKLEYQKEQERLSEVDELGGACWRSNAEIGVDLVLEEDDVCIGRNLN